MMRRNRLLALLAVAALTASSALAPPARAESIDADAVALGWQTEHAHEVLIVTAESAADAPQPGLLAVSLHVEETIRGDLAAGASAVVVAGDHGDAAPWTVGARYLAFLDPSPSAPPAARRFTLVSGPFGLRRIDGIGRETRFPGIVREFAATLDATGRVRDEPALRALLVRLMADADPGVAWSAATDFVRHEELHAALTDAERASVAASYVRCPIGKATKGALAFALAASRHADAAGALVDTLQLPDARFVRGQVAEALRRLGDPAAERLLGAKLTAAPAAARKSLLVAIGVVGTAESVPVVRRALADEDAAVRAEAAHALGLGARNVRAADASARVLGREDLDHLVAAAKTDDERRAALWALAQIDEPEAWAILRRTAADEQASDFVRKTAAHYLREPRVSLLLE